MARDLNEAFVKDPTKFALDTPVIPPGGQATQGKTKSYKDMPENFKGVPGLLRIVAADLEKRGAHVEVVLSYDRVDEKLAAGWMAIYWLPWTANHCIRTTLRPRSEIGRDEKLKTGNRAVVKLTASNGYQKDPNDPDIFFTAAVDGCMIIVDGSPSQPIVYHANRKDLETETELGAKDDERVPQMIKDVGGFNAKRPKEPRGLVVPAAKPMGVTAHMYMPFEKKSEWGGKSLTGGSDKERKILRKDMGAIFGFRRDAVWQFWYQRLLRFDHQVLQIETVEDEDEPTGQREFRSWDHRGQGYHLCELTKFWPDGNGHVVA
jgi:hypothetical protein